MKSAFIITDLEGTAGITSFALEALEGAPYLDRARRLATAELGAAVEGLVDSGVEDILVMDGHRPGGLWYEDLHPAVQVLHGRPPAPHSVIDPIMDRYEVGLIIGQHAMAGVRSSNMNHTQSPETIDYIKVNGIPVGEIAQSALYWGAAGIPFIFLSGEEDACLEATELIPGIETVSVKKGLGRDSAISLAPAAARQAIKEGAARSVARHRVTPVRPTVWDGPYTLEKRFFFTDTADDAANRPGVERVDSQTIRVSSPEIRSVIYQ
jgi:D-amino peptidase